MHPILLFTLLFLPGIIESSNPIMKKMMQNYPFLQRPKLSDQLIGDNEKNNKIIMKNGHGHNALTSKSGDAKTDIRGTIEYFSTSFDRKAGKYVPNGYTYHKFEFKDPESHSEQHKNKLGSCPFCRKPLATEDENKMQELKQLYKCPFCKQFLTHANKTEQIEFKNLHKCPFCKEFLTVAGKKDGMNFKEPQRCPFCKQSHQPINAKVDLVQTLYRNSRPQPDLSKLKGKEIKKKVKCPFCQNLFSVRNRNVSIPLKRTQVCPHCKNIIAHSQENIDEQNNCTCCPKSSNFNHLYLGRLCPCCKCKSKPSYQIKQNHEANRKQRIWQKSDFNKTIVRSLNGNLFKTIVFLKNDGLNSHSMKRPMYKFVSSLGGNKKTKLNFDNKNFDANFQSDKGSNLKNIYFYHLKAVNLDPVKQLNNFPMKELKTKPAIYKVLANNDFKTNPSETATSKSNLQNKYLKEYERRQIKDKNIKKNVQKEILKEKNIDFIINPVDEKNTVKLIKHPLKNSGNIPKTSKLMVVQSSNYITIKKDTSIDVEVTPKIDNDHQAYSHDTENKKIRFLPTPSSVVMSVAKTKNNTQSMVSMLKRIENIIGILKSNKTNTH